MPHPITLTNQQARRFILRRLGLIGGYRYHGKQGALEYLRHVHAIQLDPVDVCGKSAELTLLSRVGSFKKSHIPTLLYKDKAAFEYDDKCLCMLPVEDWPSFAFHRAHRKAHQRVAIPPGVHTAIRQRLSEGPHTPATIGIEGTAPLGYSWKNTPAPMANAALEAMYRSGEVVIAGRSGTLRSFTLPESSFTPSTLNAPPAYETAEGYFEWAIQRRVAACGLLWAKSSDAWLNIHGMKSTERTAAFSRLTAKGRLIPIQVEGIAEPLYCLGSDRPLLRQVLAGAKWQARCELIAPLDSFIWDRKLIEALFGFAYKWEIYTPQAQRKYGHYVLPILRGEGFAGRVEAVRSKNGQTLEVKNIWLEPGARRTKHLEAALLRTLGRLADLNGCTELTGFDTAFK